MNSFGVLNYETSESKLTCNTQHNCPQANKFVGEVQKRMIQGPNITENLKIGHFTFLKRDCAY